MTKFKTLFATLSFGCALAAQGPVVVPDTFANKEAPSSYGSRMSYTPSRHMFFYDSSVIKGLVAGPYKSIAFRRDGTDTSTFVRHTFNVTLHTSAAGVPAPARVNPSSFSVNVGTDYTRVLNNKAVTFPADLIPKIPPAPFTVTIPLDKPFVFPKGPNNFLLQIDLSYSNNAYIKKRWVPDADFNDPGAGATNGFFSTFGSGCPPGKKTGGAVPCINGINRLGIYWYSGGGYSQPAIAAFGKSQRRWGGYTLPFDLKTIGAQGCMTYCGMNRIVAGLTDPNGTKGRFRLDILPPYIAALAGLTCYSQIYVFDSSYNPAGIRVSGGMKMTLGSYLKRVFVPYRTLYTYHWKSTNPIPDKPKFASFYGLVVQLLP